MTDDLVAAFRLDGAPARGRYVRLGPASLDPILRRHDYSRPVALLLGEAVALAALIGALFKVGERLVLQAEGEGPVSLLVAEYRMDGGLRGYARLREGAEARIAAQARMSPEALLGAGAFALTLDRGPGYELFQGVVALEGESLSHAAEAYFRQSEQTPTALRVAVGEVFERDAPALWRCGGALIQQVAGDEARGDTDEDWSRATILFDSVRDDELLDPALPADRVLYRLFHEEGVRMADPKPLLDRCPCDAGRLAAVLARLPQEELREHAEPDGLIHARCQFCSRLYHFRPEELTGD